MKKFLYILYIGILLTGCAQNNTKYLEKHDEYSNKVKYSKKKDVKKMEAAPIIEEVRTQKFDKKLNVNTSKAKDKVIKQTEIAFSDDNHNTSKKKEMTIEQAKASDFDEISAQKLQQLFDISLLLNNKDVKPDMKKYAQQHAQRLFAQRVNYKPKNIDKLFSPGIDSISILKIKLLNMTEVDSMSQIGKYQLQILPFKNGKKQPVIYKKAKIFFETDELQMEGGIYRTIKGKIYEID